MISISVRNLAKATTEEALTALFAQYGVVRSLKFAKDLFSGECRGFATIEMEGHEARAAIGALNGTEFEGRQIRVDIERPRGKRGGSRRRR